MPNPYRDAEGKFASRDELVAKIANALKENKTEEYYQERKNLEDIDATVERESKIKALADDLASRKAKYTDREASQYIKDAVDKFPLPAEGVKLSAKEEYTLAWARLKAQKQAAEEVGRPLHAQGASMAGNSIRRAYDENSEREEHEARQSKNAEKYAGYTVNTFPDASNDDEYYTNRLKDKLNAEEISTIEASRRVSGPERTRLESKARGIDKGLTLWLETASDPANSTLKETRTIFRDKWQELVLDANKRAAWGELEGYNLVLSFENEIPFRTLPREN